MNFLKKGIEYNKLAKAFNSTFVMVNDIEAKITHSSSTEPSDAEQDLLIMAYVCRKDIQDRLEKYGWKMASPIMIPMISKGQITLIFAYQQTVGRIIKLSQQLNIDEEVLEILEKGDAFYQIEKLIEH